MRAGVSFSAGAWGTFENYSESLEPVSGLTSNYIRVKVPEVNASRNSWLEVLLKKRIITDIV